MAVIFNKATGKVEMNKSEFDLFQAKSVGFDLFNEIQYKQQLLAQTLARVDQLNNEVMSNEVQSTIEEAKAVEESMAMPHS